MPGATYSVRHQESIWTFQDPAQPWRVVGLFVGYLATSVLAMAAAVQLWMLAAGPMSPPELVAAAQASSFFARLQVVLGSVLGAAAGFLACQWAGSIGLTNSLLVGVVLTGYAVLSVFLHRELAWWQHVIHVAAPIPLTLAGGAVRMYASSWNAKSNAAGFSSC